jgi:hypothetical protein
MVRFKKILFGLSLWMWWILTSIFGIVLGLVIATLIFQIPELFTPKPFSRLSVFITHLIVGLTLGIVQAWVFNRYLPQPKRWVLASVIGFSVGAFLMAISEPLLPFVPDALSQFEGYVFLPSAILAMITIWSILRGHFHKPLGWSVLSGLPITIFIFVMPDLGYYPTEYNLLDSFYLAFLVTFPTWLFSGPLLIYLLGRMDAPERLFARPRPADSQDGQMSTLGTGPKTSQSFLPMKLALLNIFIPVLLMGAMFAVIVPIDPPVPRYVDNSGLETTPAEFEAAQELWESRPFSHYRLVARYWTQIDYCEEDVEILNEEVVSVYPTDNCRELGHRSVTELFEMFTGYVGDGPRRPEVGNGCEFWYVDAIYDEVLGYPTFMKNQTILNIDERNQYVTREHSFSCLLFGPVQLTLEIESVTPLP